MKPLKQLLIAAALSTLVACVTTEPAPTAVDYNYDSWRTMIPDSCTHFFDGCNTCRRAPGAEMAACTRMACPKYEKPVCLDDQTQATVAE